MTTNDLIGTALGAGALVVLLGPVLLGRHILRRRHAETLTATGVFELPDATADEPVLATADGEVLTEADLAARTAPQEFTVDPERLAEVLQLERTAEYPYSAATWVECDAAEQFLRDPLGSSLLPPDPLIVAAGNPALADTLWTLLGNGGLTTDWSDADSEFHFWDTGSALAGPVDPDQWSVEDDAALDDEREREKAGAHR